MSDSRLRDIVVQAEETGRVMAREFKALMPRQVATFEERGSNVQVNTRLILLDKQGCGQLVELTIVAPNGNFGVMIVVDGGSEEEKTFTELVAEAAYVNDVAAFQQDSNYVVHLMKMKFTKSLRVVVGGSLTLIRTHLKYELGQ